MTLPAFVDGKPMHVTVTQEEDDIISLTLSSLDGDSTFETLRIPRAEFLEMASMASPHAFDSIPTPHGDEYSVKIPIDNPTEVAQRLLAQGARVISIGTHQLDSYLSTKEDGLFRIREEGGGFQLSTKDPIHQELRSSGVKRTDIILTGDDVDEYKKKYQELARVEKSRDAYLLPNGTIACIDDVFNLGTFLEISGPQSTKVTDSANSLGLDPETFVQKSYVDLTLEKEFPAWKANLIRFHRVFGEKVQGVVAGTLATMGFFISIGSSNPGNVKLLLLAMAGTALYDGFSDSYAKAAETLSETRGDHTQATKAFFSMYLGKVSMPFTFLPIALFSLPSLVPYLSYAWTTLVVGAIAAEQALATEKPVFRSIIKSAGVVTFVGGLGVFVAKFLGG